MFDQATDAVVQSALQVLDLDTPPLYGQFFPALHHLYLYIALSDGYHEHIDCIDDMFENI